MRTIERALSAEPIPTLSGPVAYVFSDYGGSHQASQYDTIGVLYLDLYGSAAWDVRRREVRRSFLGDGRRMSFKNLGDRQRKAALAPFLRAADEIEGLCLVVGIRKSIRTLCVDADLTTRITEGLHLRRQWRQASFEALARVAHLIGLLVGGLSRPGQAIYWVSDEDALFANEATTLDLKEVLGQFSSHYIQHKLGELGLGTAALDPGDRYEEDCLAVADLAAGATAEVLTSLSAAAGGHIPAGLAIPWSGSFSPKTERVYTWFSASSISLRKVCILFEDLPGGGLAVSRFGSGDSAV